jgi:glutamate-5-semialdehyde dehydrogenase
MMKEMGLRARSASRLLARAETAQKNAALLCLADDLLAEADGIIDANNLDVSNGTAKGLSPALLDRLTLNENRLSGVVSDLRRVASLPDPVGEHFEEAVLSNGLRVHKQRVPLGVLGIIYEARPNVTIDVAGLAIKTGNAVILRGGSETINTNRTLVATIRKALAKSDLPPDAVQFIDDPDRARVFELLHMHDFIDMLIPRGGAELHRFCRENSRIPVITGGIGICHLFVDKSADLTAALKVIQNAKLQRPTVCNALDTVLIHKEIAAEFLPGLVSLLAEDGVAFRADETAQPFLVEEFTGANLGEDPLEVESHRNHEDRVGSRLHASVKPAGPDDFDTEWLSLILGLKVVDGLDEAMDHISVHSTGHSDGILTRDDTNARRFVAEVDSAAVYVNASTRFTDGGQLGLGAEVAVSTQRLHARGPMGLRELTTYKWVVLGNYHVRN